MDELGQFLQQPSLTRDLLLALLGLCVGSFLNVLALRSLQEKSLLSPPSHCPKCEHHLGFFDLIPVISWVLLAGKCRYCGVKISWHYPFVELITACAFVLIVRHFGFNFEGLGMVVFACTLIAVCVTDFKEKLIPHEITYPSMLLGIVYTVVCAHLNETGTQSLVDMHHELIGGLAGIGISYMLFDFLAFYGLKLYIRLHGEPAKVLDDETEV